MIFIFNICAPQSVSRPEIFFSQRLQRRMKVSDSRSQIMRVDFFILCPFPNFLNAIFSFPSRFRIFGIVTNTQTPGHLGDPRASLLLASGIILEMFLFFLGPRDVSPMLIIFVRYPLIKTHYVQISHLSPSQSCQSSRNLKPLLADRTARTQAFFQFYQLDSFRQQ